MNTEQGLIAVFICFLLGLEVGLVYKAFQILSRMELMMRTREEREWLLGKFVQDAMKRSHDEPCPCEGEDLHCRLEEDPYDTVSSEDDEY